jgi:hypothetical protein
MSDTDNPGTHFSLGRWSRRKLAAARTQEPPATSVMPAVAAGASPAPGTTQDGNAAAPHPAPELPAIDSLTFESDFAAFLQPRVDESLRRQALKKLFSDPRFNVMDGLDVYIDDYGKADPIDPEVVRQLVQARYLFDPPQTRVNEHGMVEDIPADAEVADAADADADPGASTGAPSSPPAAPQPDAGAGASDSRPAAPTAPATRLPTTPES